MKPIVTEEVYKVRYYELKNDWKASISAIMDYFNDIVTLQTVEIGHGVEVMSKGEYAWLLLRWDIAVSRYPDFMESVVVRTTPHSMDRFYAYRRFEIFDNSGQRIVEANSQWILIDQNRRRPVRIGEELYRRYGIDEGFHRPLSFPKISEFESKGEMTTLRVRKSDLDTNGHSNNVSYVKWLMEAIPEEFDGKTLRRLTIEYRHESRKEDEVLVDGVFQNKSSFVEGLHRISKREKLLTLARTEWI
ncbi:MAG TPA: thioesterase [Mesotoga sp.]|uniref:acyl-[acyl-carrier-protein] thioesterase n=1 Tax=unclassified Mesotoga TaxID=1184398 RepID=UPI000AE42B3F|nr:MULTISPECIES: acyl-ACP thioesterase domain-containing protein [unclassified Mesotoga]PXF33992.1 acyl-ACP thioesterase [Mesotoga sp. SC_NapDC]RAM59224.1 acyl-ACP thioesterase [Mesotoga sp. SC_3PWM13N19]RAM59872.1 acyl-ACP thioesterase [Mesotoga sp. SC_4PWA21]MDD3461248.1 thioesterase [Mesotoga sp.]HAY98412.1 acyl-ACP thioesterase [Mesotoga sp.]